MEIMRLKCYQEMICDANQLSWYYHVNCMIIICLGYVFTALWTSCWWCVGVYKLLLCDMVFGRALSVLFCQMASDLPWCCTALYPKCLKMGVSWICSPKKSYFTSWGPLPMSLTPKHGKLWCKLERILKEKNYQRTMCHKGSKCKSLEEQED
jgi:hypothetical protein